MIDPAELETFRRGLREATRRWRGDALDVALADLGWLDALEVDPHLAVSLLFEAQGNANATSKALGRVLATGLGVDEPDAGRRLVLPALEQDRAPGRFIGDRCRVHGLATFGSTESGSVLVVAESDGQWVSVALQTADLQCRSIAGVDPELGLVDVTGEVPGIRPGACRPVDWEGALALGQRTLGHELVGSSRAMLELAREHAIDRVQFGRPVASFQAVRHRLADCLVAIEGAGALLDAAWEDPAPAISSMAKASAGRAARSAARHCQQVLAGIGFTTEHPFHRHLRRTLVLDQLLGGGTALTRRTGTEILGGQWPPLLEL